MIFFRHSDNRYPRVCAFFFFEGRNRKELSRPMSGLKTCAIIGYLKYIVRDEVVHWLGFSRFMIDTNNIRFCFVALSLFLRFFSPKLFGNSVEISSFFWPLINFLTDGFNLTCRILKPKRLDPVNNCVIFNWQPSSLIGQFLPHLEGNPQRLPFCDLLLPTAKPVKKKSFKISRQANDIGS